MKKLKQLKKHKQNNFLHNFIQEEMYLQNPPMTTDKFVDFCKKRGIETTKDELKFFGEENLLNPINKENEEKYSSFQIYWLEILKKSFSITLSLAGDEIKASSSFVLLDNRQGNGSFSFKSINDFTEKLKEIAKKEPFKDFFDLKKKKEKLRDCYKEFNIILFFLLSVQNVYFPYAKSGGGTIQIIGDDKKWQEAKHNFKLDDTLKNLSLKIEDVAKWYKIFSENAQNILGIKRDDWVQLWKNIAWSEKDKLEGNVKLGVEYLQLAVMLKRVIEEYLQKEILDIDEMSNISADDILKFNPQEMNQCGVLLRATRNKRYSDKDKNYYQDRYKRLFYFANNFGLDYQPRVTVFVEGKTEETIFPKIFEQYIGNKPENLGIEFINIQGISQFFGQKISIKNSSNKYQKGFISNFNHLSSYNLNKWQIIPFFIGDDENNISNLLKNGLSISFNQNQYSFPKDWQYIWGITNKNNPFQGKDFEMANFSDDELAKVLSDILPKQIEVSDVKTQRDQNKGIKQIDEGVEKCKVCIARKLIGNLFDKYEETKDESIFERPIFKALGIIRKLAVLNHPPVDREIELKNKEYIEKELKK